MQIASDLRIKTSHYIITGFSLVVALSWNESIKIFISKIFPLANDALIIRFTYSIIITLALILLIKFMPNTVRELPNQIRTEIFKNY